VQSTQAANIETTAAEEPAVVQQQPAEPVVPQAETEIVDETKYMHSAAFTFGLTHQSFWSYSRLFRFPRKEHILNRWSNVSL